MTHTNCRFSVAKPFSASLFSVAVTAAGMLGCSAPAAPGAEAGDVSSVTGPLALQHEVVIHYTDDRTATSFQVGITAVDQSNGAFDGGNAFVPGPITGGTDGQDFMLWSQTGLSQEISAATGQPAYTQNASWITIIDAPTAPHRFTTMRVSVLATINGACHYASQDIDMSQGADLIFNGYGASLIGGCWVGDLLRRP